MGDRITFRMHACRGATRKKTGVRALAAHAG